MPDPVPPKRVFEPARVEAKSAAEAPETPQTVSPAYRLAFQDMDFLLREDLRPVRFQLELLKPELLLDEARIASTFVFYGSARIPEPAKADALIETAATDQQRRIAERLKAKGITRVVFDRNGFLYHGRIKAVAEAAREAGLEF